MPKIFPIKLPDGKTVFAELKFFANAKYLRFNVRDNGKVLISSPAGVSLKTIQKHASEFSPKLQEILQKRILPEPELPDFFEIPFANRVISIIKDDDTALHPLSPDRIEFILEDDALLIKGGLQGHSILPCFHAFLQKLGQTVLPPVIRSFAPGTDFALSIRNQRTRMGSCSQKKQKDGMPRISINWRAMLLPEPMLRHLCLHEVAHIRHMNHSAVFYQWLECLSPDCRKKEKELNSAWRELPRWVFYEN